MHEHNTNKFIECIQASHDVCGPNNLIAVKVTSLVRPTVLKRFNTILKSIKDRSSLPPIFQLINNQEKTNQLSAILQESVNLPAIKNQVIDFILPISRIFASMLVESNGSKY